METKALITLLAVVNPLACVQGGDVYFDTKNGPMKNGVSL